jgi:hypothetical protein
MEQYTEAFVGIDTAKNKHALAIADPGRDGEIRYLGEIDSAPAAVQRVIRKLAGRYEKLYFCYEAGPTGYGLYRQVRALGLVSRASPVQTAVRNCTRDEGGPFGFGDQVADPKPPQAAVVKSHGGERCGNAGTMIPAGTVERGERKRTVSEVSKAD